MSPERFREIVSGALAIWEADVHVQLDARDCGCRILRGGETIVEVSHEQTPLGGAWRIEVTGRMTRTHLSVVPALATLRDAICPARNHGRVWFVAESPDYEVRP